MCYPTVMDIICVFFLIFFSQFSHSKPLESKYSICSRSFSCGRLDNIPYPFWGGHKPRYCGGFDELELQCESLNVWFTYASQDFYVSNINATSYTIKLSRPDDFFYDICDEVQLSNITLDFNLFQFTSHVYNITVFYNCPHGYLYGGNNITCPHSGSSYTFYGNKSVVQKYPDLQHCGLQTQVHSLRDIPLYGGGMNALRDALVRGFEMSYSKAISEECRKCMDIQGICGSSENDTDKFYCYCPEGSDSLSSCHDKFRWVFLVGGAGVFGLCAGMIASYCFYLHQKQNQASNQRPSILAPSNNVDSGRLNFRVHHFTYEELKEATDNFDRSKFLGYGGYSKVYHGKLRDGRAVAVKKLNEYDPKRLVVFMNEVENLSHLRHPNVVSLYGCTSHHDRELLLVYEYISNGTLADHLHGSLANSGSLPWQHRIKIAIETADALKYLYSSRIIHRDIKTRNILLDDQFHVKVADFGTSRLLENPNKSYTLTGPQGTRGYMDPKYEEAYRLSYKADIYSFGVVLMELISSKLAWDEKRPDSERLLGNMALSMICEQNKLHEFVDQTLGFDSDQEVNRMINAVAELACRCLQPSENMRPSIEEVLDTLRNIENNDAPKSQPEALEITQDDLHVSMSGASSSAVQQLKTF